MASAAVNRVASRNTATTVGLMLVRKEVILAVTAAPVF
jgi:hypothetical protein